MASLAWAAGVRADGPPPVPSGSPKSLLYTEVAEPPEAATTVGLLVEGGLQRDPPPGSQITYYDHRLRASAAFSASLWRRLELGLVIPVTALVANNATDVATALVPNAVSLDPVHVSAKLALWRRTTGRGVALATRVAADLPFTESSKRAGGPVFTTGDLIVDARFWWGVVVALNAGVEAGSGWQRENFHLSAVRYAAGVAVPIGAGLSLVGDVHGRLPLPNIDEPRAEFLGGLRFHLPLGSRFEDSFTLNLAAGGGTGGGLPDFGKVLVYLQWSSGGAIDEAKPERDPAGLLAAKKAVAPAATPKEKPLPPSLLHEDQQAISAYLQRARAELTWQGELVDSAAAEAEADWSGGVQRTIQGAPEIKDDQQRLHELHVHFLERMFAEKHVTIGRFDVEEIVDRVNWRCQPGRHRCDDISKGELAEYEGDRVADAFREYGRMQRRRAEMLAAADEALFANKEYANEIIADWGIAHINGVVGLINGVLDLPVMPYNLAQRLRHKPGIHLLGHIPRLDYRSDWGRKFGTYAEAGVVIGLGARPSGSAMTNGIGGALGRAAPYVEGLSAGNLRLGPILLRTIGTLFRVSGYSAWGHAALDLRQTVTALRTGLIEDEDGSVRALTEDDVPRLLVNVVTDIVMAKGVTESLVRGEAHAQAAASVPPQRWRPTEALVEQIRAAEKGDRPEATTYIPPDVVRAHLAEFSQGVAKIAPEGPPANGAVGPFRGTFVFPKSLLKDLIAKSGRDPRKLERLLGLDDGRLGNDPVLIDIPSPKGLRMPSGNEPGANGQWLPGGFTSGGLPEATIDPAPPGTYTVSPAFPPRRRNMRAH